MLKIILKCSAAAAVAYVPSGVSAQETDRACDVSEDCIVIADYKRTDIVVTAIGSDSLPENTGQAISLLETGIIEQRQPESVSALLDAVPGITVSRNGGIGKTTALRIRGAEGDQTLTLIDGVRVNDPSSPGGAFDFGNLLVGNIERIEVLRGPHSVPWGSQAIGGVVNIVTAQSLYGIGGSARAEYGYQDRFNLTANLYGGNEVINASLGGGYFRDDGISAFKNGSERDGYRQYAANGKIAIKLSSDIDIDLRGYFADSKTQLDGFPPPFFGFADTSDFSTTQELFGYAGVNFRLFGEALKNRAAFTISDINRDNFSAPGQVVPDFLARGRTERFEYQGDAQLGDTIRLVFGAEHENVRFNDGFTFARTNVTSGYGQIILNPADALTITGGARIDDHRDYGSEVTFSANAAWRPSDNTIIRAAYGEGFKAPTLFQLNSSFGNVTLQPERAKSYEIGVEQNLIDSAVVLTITGFLRNTDNQIDFISCFGQTTGICTARPFGTYDNVDRTRAQGVEFSANIRPAHNFTVDANYSYVDSKDRVSGLALLRRPKHDVNVNADWQAFKGFNIGASLQMVSDSIDVDFQTFSRTRLDGYALFGLRASYEFIDGFSVYGRVDNLSDESYETVSGYGNYGRNAHIGIRARF